MTLRGGLLGLLMLQSASGYDLLKMFNESLNFVWPASQSQVYTELNKLSREGLVEVTSPGVRNRKLYTITNEGRSAFHRWLTDEAQEGFVRSEVMLRTFFLWSFEPGEARTFLEQFRDRRLALRQQLLALVDSIEWDETDAVALSSRVVLEYGIRSTTTLIEWAQWVLDNYLDVLATRVVSDAGTVPLN